MGIMNSVIGSQQGSLAIRRELYVDYLRELNKIEGITPLSQTAAEECMDKILYQGDTTWYDIRLENGEIVGFLIIGQNTNCHPDADFFIDQAYILPKFRKRGLMTKAISEFIEENRGRFCLFIIDNNTYARSFWFKTFAGLGYVPLYLRDVGALKDETGISQYGFAPI